MSTVVDEFKLAVDAVASTLEADIFLLSSSIYDEQADRFISIVRNIEKKRKNAALILCTNGGNADAGYQIARCLQRSYGKFILYVFGNCKSTGTLVAIGANEIVMSEFGQFGPLDVQLADKNEFYGQTPALDVSQSLATLSNSSFDCFLNHFLKLEPGRGISTRTAVEIAKTLTLAIIEPIAGQIDPILLGRVDRSMKIAEAYIKRLNPRFKATEQIIGGYPSHGFVIDLKEAETIFENVREPNPGEEKIENSLRIWSKVPKQDNWIGLLSTELKDISHEAITTTSTAAPTERNGGASTANAGEVGSGPKPATQPAGDLDQAGDRAEQARTA